MNEGMMRPGHWLGLVLSIAFSILTLMVRWQKGYSACKNPRGSPLEHMQQEDPRGTIDPGTPGKTAVKWK